MPSQSFLDTNDPRFRDPESIAQQIARTNWEENPNDPVRIRKFARAFGRRPTRDDVERNTDFRENPEMMRYGESLKLGGAFGVGKDAVKREGGARPASGTRRDRRDHLTDVLDAGWKSDFGPAEIDKRVRQMKAYGYPEAEIKRFLESVKQARDRVNRASKAGVWGASASDKLLKQPSGRNDPAGRTGTGRPSSGGANWSDLLLKGLVGTTGDVPRDVPSDFRPPNINEIDREVDEWSRRLSIKNRQGARKSDQDKNAFAHAYASGVLSRDLGWLASGSGGLLREIRGYVSGRWKASNGVRKYTERGVRKDGLRDMYNNVVGLQIGEYAKANGLPREAIGYLAHDALRNGLLVADEGSDPRIGEYAINRWPKYPGPSAAGRGAIRYFFG